MLSLDIRQILPPKMSFSFIKKYKFRQKFCHKAGWPSPHSPILSNFIKNQYFRHDGQFSSFRQFFVKNEILWSVQMNAQLEAPSSCTRSIKPVKANYVKLSTDEAV